MDKNIDAVHASGRQQQAEKSSELLAYKIIENLPFPMAVHLPPPDWRFTQVNQKFAQTFGYSAAEFETVIEFTDKVIPDSEYRREAYAWFAECHARAKAGDGRVGPRELAMTARDGRKLTILFSATILEDLVVVAMQDITTLKETAAKLTAAQEVLEKTAFALTENIPVGTYTMVQPPDGGMGRFSFMSTRFLELTGVDRESALEDPLKAFACIHPDEYEDWVRKNAETFEKKIPFREECRVLADGKIRWMLAESTPRDLPDGSVVWEGVLADITLQKQLEKMEAARSEILLALLADKPLKEIFASIAKFISELIPGALSAILTVEKSTGLLRLLHGGGLPADYAKSLDGVAVENDRHRAALAGEPVLSNDLAREPNWAEHREATTKAGLGACWAQPISSHSGGILGVLAVYHTEPAGPSLRDTRQIQLAAILVSLAIEQKTVAAERAAREKAEFENLAKAEFLAKMSHELRTPLHAITGFSGMLKRDPRLEPDMVEKIGTIVNSGEHLLAMVNDILEYGRIESGAVRLVEEEFCLHELLGELALIYSAKAAGKNLEFHLDCAPTVPRHATADGSKLRQIVTNLLENAIKFTPEGRVCLRARMQQGSKAPLSGNKNGKSPSRLLVEVEDSGCGVNEQEHEAIFDDFFQGSLGEKKGGTGLGLSISKQLAETMGGAIGFHNRREGGACFWVEIPLGARKILQTLPSLQMEGGSSGLLPLPPNQSGPLADSSTIATKLGAPLHDAMRAALALGDMPTMRELCTKVANIDPGLAAHFRALANKYDYVTLGQLLGNGDPAN